MSKIKIDGIGIKGIGAVPEVPIGSKIKVHVAYTYSTEAEFTARFTLRLYTDKGIMLVYNVTLDKIIPAGSSSDEAVFTVDIPKNGSVISQSMYADIDTLNVTTGESYGTYTSGVIATLVAPAPTVSITNLKITEISTDGIAYGDALTIHFQFDYNASEDTDVRPLVTLKKVRDSKELEITNQGGSVITLEKGTGTKDAYTQILNQGNSDYYVYPPVLTHEYEKYFDFIKSTLILDIIDTVGNTLAEKIYGDQVMASPITVTNINDKDNKNLYHIGDTVRPKVDIYNKLVSDGTDKRIFVKVKFDLFAELGGGNIKNVYSGGYIEHAVYYNVTNATEFVDSWTIPDDFPYSGEVPIGIKVTVLCYDDIHTPKTYKFCVMKYEPSSFIISVPPIAVTDVYVEKA